MPERFKVVCTMQGAIQVLSFTSETHRVSSKIEIFGVTRSLLYTITYIICHNSYTNGTEEASRQYD